jgi:prephenate dehydratase
MNDGLRVAYQGERGAFSESAARRLMGEAAALPFPSFEEMFDAVREGDADCCVAPIENSLAGSIHRNYDLLLDSNLTILGETNLRIVHNLLSTADSSLESIRRVYSHPVALAQCGRFLRAHPGIEAVPVHDTAGAVRMVMERGQASEAAIASDRAAEIYGAITLAAGIEDHARNFTRFVLAAPKDKGIDPLADGQARRWKTSLLLHVANKPGALFRALGAFALREIDLAKIESRPIEGRPWEYGFYLDVIGKAAEEPLAGALETLRGAAETITILGSYPTRW